MNKKPAIIFFFLFLLAGACSKSVFAHEFNQRAYDSLQQQLKRSIKDTTRINILLEMATLFWNKDTQQSSAFGRQAITLSEKIHWTGGQLKSKLQLGRFYDDNNNKIAALHYYYSCPRTASNSTDSDNVATLYNLIGNLYLQENRFDSTLQYYKSSLLYLTQPGDRLSMMANTGQINAKIGDYPGALESYLDALKLNERLLKSNTRTKEDSLTKTGLLIFIGDVYIEMSQYDQAFTNYNEAFALNKLLKNPTIEISALNGIAQTFSFKENYQQAAAYYEKALVVSKESNDLGNESSILADLGNVYLMVDNAEKALFYTINAQDLAESNHFETPLPKIYTTLGRIYTRKKNYQEALRYLQIAIDISKKTGSDTDQRDAWQVLSQVYEKMNQPVAALDAYKQYYALRDTVYNVDKARQMTSAVMQYRFDTKQLADSLQSSAYKLKIQRQRIYIYSGMTGIVLMLLLSFFIYRSYSRTKKTNVIISKANETINVEKQVSENLLLNILPKNVADELKANGKVKAKLFENVSVLFTDFVNFTQTAERLSPEELVEELDTCFKAFDEITAKYNVEKVKTVGDAYMAVSGLPLATPEHASEILKAAIEMRDFMIARKAIHKDHTFDMRLGVHSGKVVAGIVGMKKFAYDVWGDTVNTAARMEQCSDEGKINISDQTWQLVKDQFRCVDRGEIDAKNKGKMRMYFVESLI